jgi:hypothetical protein
MHRPTRDRYSQRGTPASPDKLAGKQRPDDCGDDHDRTRNAHSPRQHHAPATFAIEKTTLPKRASPITEATFPSPASVPIKVANPVRLPWPGPSACGAGVRRSPGDAARGENERHEELPTTEMKMEKAVDGPSIPTYKKNAAALSRVHS